MGNTIVCPLSAESRGDRDSSGRRQQPGEGRRPVGLGEGASERGGGRGEGRGRRCSEAPGLEAEGALGVANRGRPALSPPRLSGKVSPSPARPPTSLRQRRGACCFQARGPAAARRDPRAGQKRNQTSLHGPGTVLLDRVHCSHVNLML